MRPECPRDIQIMTVFFYLFQLFSLCDKKTGKFVGDLRLLFFCYALFAFIRVLMLSVCGFVSLLRVGNKF